MRAEAGCLEYAPAIDVATELRGQVPPRDDVVFVVEKWASLDALKAHAAAPHVAEYIERVKGMVTSLKLQVLQPA